MKSYNELLNVLNVQDNVNGKYLSYNNSEVKFNSFELFDILVWKLRLDDKSFKLISSSFDYTNISSCDLKKFLNTIKPCFQEYFINYFKKYYQILFQNKINITEFRLQGFLPIKLKIDRYELCVITIIPIINNHIVFGFYFTVTPLKKYNNEYVNLKIFKDRKEEKFLTYKISNSFSISDQLTKKQSEVFELILNGFSSAYIAKQLNKNKSTVLSYNIRIKEKMTTFFEIDFETVVDSANYYKNCFLLN